MTSPSCCIFSELIWYNLEHKLLPKDHHWHSHGFNTETCNFVWKFLCNGFSALSHNTGSFSSKVAICKAVCFCWYYILTQNKGKDRHSFERPQQDLKTPNFHITETGLGKLLVFQNKSGWNGLVFLWLYLHRKEENAFSPSWKMATVHCAEKPEGHFVL